MVVVEKTGKTLEEALEEAVKELQIPAEEIKYTVIEEGNKGFLGFLSSKNYKIRAEMTENMLAEIRSKQLLEKILKEMNLNATMDITGKDENLYINIKGKALGSLIGRRGQSLDSLQYILNLSVNRGLEKRVRVLLDVEGYRAKREEILKKLALRLAEKVRRDHRKTILEPMSPHERRIIHCALQNEKGIFTYSEGVDPYRRVIISPNAD